MKYYFKENFRLFYADGQLYDEEDNIAYEYQNQTLLFPKIELYRQNEVIGYIQKRFTWFLRQYDIYYGERFIDSIKQQIKFFGSELYLNNLGWRIEGDIFALHYKILDQDNLIVAEVDQEIFRLTRRYFVNITDEENEELILLLILAINQFDKDLSAAASSAHSSSNSR